MMNFMTQPRTVGYWQIGGAPGLQVHLTTRPRWLTRLACRLIFEFTWHDAEWVPIAKDRQQ